jgi:hypothetical protein
VSLDLEPIRELVESLTLDDVCRITRPASLREASLDAQQQLVPTAQPEVVYEGQCGIRPADPQARFYDLGGQEVTDHSHVLKTPRDAPLDARRPRGGARHRARPGARGAHVHGARHPRGQDLRRQPHDRPAAAHEGRMRVSVSAPTVQVAGELRAGARGVSGVLRPVVEHYTMLLETRVKANASGRPGPEAPTGDYRRSIGRQMSSAGGTVVGSVGTNRWQARRLEFGFTGTDSLGRYYDQPPYPHFGPAVDQVGPAFEAAAAGRPRGAAVPGRASRTLPPARARGAGVRRRLLGGGRAGW